MQRPLVERVEEEGKVRKRKWEKKGKGKRKIEGGEENR